MVIQCTLDISRSFFHKSKTSHGPLMRVGYGCVVWVRV